MPGVSAAGRFVGVAARGRSGARSRRPRAGGWTVGIAVVGFLVLVAAVYFAVRESADPRFGYTGLQVTGGAHTTGADVENAAAIPAGANVWLIDARAVQRRIDALPWVRSADLARAWPNRVIVRIVERTPAARLVLPSQAGGEEPVSQTALVDASLHVLSVGPAAGQGDGLPTIVVQPGPSGVTPGADLSSAGVQEAYDALVQLRALGVSIERVAFAPATGITITETAGLRVIIGTADDLAKKVELLRAIAPRISSPQDVVYVDLRSVRAPTVLYR